jgi:hypothetical protein
MPRTRTPLSAAGGRLLFAVALLVLAACAPSAPPAAAPAPGAPQPAAAARAGALEVPDAAERVSQSVQLTGLELGTMWTVENPPLDYWQKTYNFTPTQEWLDNVRLASVRYGQHCSASFVSPEGLVMTNHHCARDCVEAVSTGATDYVAQGFYASRRDRELLCPGLYLDQLQSIENVTERVRAAAPQGGDAQAVAAAQEAERQRIEQECQSQTGLACQVVTLYHGGQFQLYRYRRFAPVKLVFAPELQAGFFGGDPDNFTYPRYALDVAFVRAYQPDSITPARTPNHFRWSPAGAQDGDLVFVTGNPGSTSRQIPVSEVMYERSYRHPFLVQFLQAQRDFLMEIASRGPEAERSVREDLFGVENSLKAYTGQLGGLRDSTLMGRKVKWEREFRQAVDANATLKAQYGDVWDQLAAIDAEKLALGPRLNLNNIGFGASPEVQLAGELIRYLRESRKPEAERAAAYRGERLVQVEQMLRNPVPVDPQAGARLLQIRLQMARDWLPADDPLIRAAFQPGETPAQAAERLVRGSRIGDVAYRQALLAGGTAAVDTASDPMVRLVRTMESTYQQILPRWQALNAQQTVQQERLANALFAVYGTKLPPDATFTLRISDGVVAGYPYNGTFAPPHTSIYGLYERATNFNNRMPWTLPKTFAERRGAVALATPFNFVTTNDITGGNSGSPLIDREARVVGIAFDGNIEQLPNEFLFDTSAGRTVAVHSAGIMESLRTVYRADALVRELGGTPAAR